MTAKTTTLWLSALPEPRTLGGSLRAAGIEHLRRSGHDVVESDLYAMGWDPVLRGAPFVQPGERFDATRDVRSATIEHRLPADVAAEQQKLLDADLVVVQFPIWWYGVPAILKGWFDRVLTSGFAFGNDPATGSRLRFEHGRLVGRRALAVLTIGDRAESIGPRGHSGQLDELLYGVLHGTFAYTGMSVLEPFAVTSADRATCEEGDRTIAALETRLDAAFDEQPIPYRQQFDGSYTQPGWALDDRLAPGESGLSIHRMDGA